MGVLTDWGLLSEATALLSSAVAIGASIVFARHFNKVIRRPNEPQVLWTLLPFIGHSIEFGVDALDLLRRGTEEFGEIFGFILAGNRVFFLSDVFSHPVLFKRNDNLSAEPVQIRALETFGCSPNYHLDFSTFHNITRKHFLTDAHLPPLIEQANASIEHVIDKINDVATDISLWDLVSTCVFGSGLAATMPYFEMSDKTFSDFIAFDKRFPMLSAGVPIWLFKSCMQGRDSLLAELINQSVNKPADGFVGERNRIFNPALVEGKCTKRDIAAFDVAILWAAYGNTVSAAFWTLMCILKDQVVLAKVREELDTLVSKEGSITLAQLEDLTFIDACMTEACRLYASIIVLREVVHPCDIQLASGKTYRFRKHDRIALFASSILMDPEIYHDPQSFLPQRWEVKEGSKEEQRSAAIGKISLTKNGKAIPLGGAFLTFGGGEHYCPGRRFARIQVKLLLLNFLTKLEIKVSAAAFESAKELDKSKTGVGLLPPLNIVHATVCRKK